MILLFVILLTLLLSCLAVPHRRHIFGRLAFACPEDAQQLAACHFLGLTYAQLIDLIMHRLDFLDKLLWRQTSELCRGLAIIVCVQCVYSDQDLRLIAFMLSLAKIWAGSTTGVCMGVSLVVRNSSMPGTVQKRIHI